MDAQDVCCTEKVNVRNNSPTFSEDDCARLLDHTQSPPWQRAGDDPHADPRVFATGAGDVSAQEEVVMSDYDVEASDDMETPGEFKWLKIGTPVFTYTSESRKGTFWKATVTAAPHRPDHFSPWMVKVNWDASARVSDLVPCSVCERFDLTNGIRSRRDRPFSHQTPRRVFTSDKPRAIPDQVSKVGNLLMAQNEAVLSDLDVEASDDEETPATFKWLAIGTLDIAYTSESRKGRLDG
jgi:hypothetical protein